MLSKGGGQDWFYHAPSQRRAQDKMPVPPASQIPGLSADDQEAFERETGTNKRNWVRDTDSKYIQLAKQGGRKNLLTFNVKELNPDPKSYPRVDWFDHVPMTIEDEKKILAERQWNPPEYMVHDAIVEPEPVSRISEVELGEARKIGRGIQEKYEGRGIPYHTDYSSVAYGKNPQGQNGELKLPKIKTNQGTAREVEFQKLLSGGYGVDWVKHRRENERSFKQKEKQGSKKQSIFNMTEYQQSISRKEIPKQKLKPIYFPSQKREEIVKAPFKLSKFSNVSSKLATGGLQS
ncbi:uncharacterized protein C7orf57 homolog [Ciona intestinalis]